MSVTIHGWIFFLFSNRIFMYIKKKMHTQRSSLIFMGTHTFLNGWFIQVYLFMVQNHWGYLFLIISDGTMVIKLIYVIVKTHPLNKNGFVCAYNLHE